VHDFLAQKVIEDLIAPEDYEARLFRDVVVAKAGVYARTGELLTYKECLGAYAHRQRIVFTPEEVELLFASSLAGNGPVRYFLRSLPNDLPVRWAEQRIRSPKEVELEEGRTRINAGRFLLASGIQVPLAELVAIFSNYKLQSELAAFTRLYSTKGDLDLLFRLRLKKAEQTRVAAVEQLERFVEPSDSPVERLLRSRRSQDTLLLCRILTTKVKEPSVPHLRSELGKRNSGSRILAICGLGDYGDESDASCLVERIESLKLSAKEREVSGYALAHWAQTNGRWNLMDKLLHLDDPVCRGALGATVNRGDLKLDTVLKQYSRLSFETAAAVLRTVSVEDKPELERFISANPLEPKIRDIIIALLRVGGGNAARWILELIGSEDYHVVFWNTPILAAALAEAMDIDAKTWLYELTDSEEFWHYTGNERTSPPLPVANVENLYLFKRLAGVALASLCDQSDWPLLKRLIFHDYWIIPVAAADQVAKFAEVAHLDEWVEKARQEARDRPKPGVVDALTLLDTKLFGQ